MPLHQKICHRVQLKTEKDRRPFKKREEKQIEGTPTIILGKYENSQQQIWMDDLKNQPISKLKDINTSQRGVDYARTILKACCGLAPLYGFFIINQNMVFFNPQRQIFAWINPDLLQNRVKIYLPPTFEGQMAMIRSIISFLKLWLRYDFSFLAEVKNLQELPNKFEELNKLSTDCSQAKFPYSNYLNISLSNKYNHPMKYRFSGRGEQKSPTKNRIFQAVQRGSFGQNKQFQHKTFNMLGVNNSAPMPFVSNSIGIPNGTTYFPNKTTSNKNYIVTMINRNDDNPNDYGKNKLLLDDEKHRQLQERQKMKKSKQILDNICEQFNDLLVSIIENQQENEDNIKKMQSQFLQVLE